MTSTEQNHRSMCYRCNRPSSSCLCAHITPLQTHTKFVILMHPKEFKQIKNNTGRLTKLSLINAELFVGVDFSHHKKINALIQDSKNYCMILYPGKNSTPLDLQKPPCEGKTPVIFIVDATWDTSKPMLRHSVNLHALPKISFTHTQTSAYGFKRQPFAQALSTIESTACVLSILNDHGIEQLSDDALANFLAPFEAMVAFQTNFISLAPRFKPAL